VPFLTELLITTTIRHYRRSMSDLQVYLVEWHDERDGSRIQLGGFTSMQEAEACRALLTDEGWADLYINIVPIHGSVAEWSADR
jgi:hypothetical protein